MTRIAMSLIAMLCFANLELPALAETPPLQLTTADIQKALGAAVAKAQEIGVPMGISIVDAGGNLLAFIKMDGAFIHTNHTSFSKAYTAASIRKPSGARAAFLRTSRKRSRPRRGENLRPCPEALPCLKMERSSAGLASEAGRGSRMRQSRKPQLRP